MDVNRRSHIGPIDPDIKSTLSYTFSLFLCIKIAYRFHEENKFEAYDIGI